MVEIIFLGTGGGRINLIKQFRKTGGFLIKSKNLLISVDPGPGALSSLNELAINPQKLDAILITHNHIDHYHDAPLLIEAMSNFMQSNKGVLISAKSIVDGDDNGDVSINKYHQSKLEQNIRFSSKDSLSIKINGTEFSLTGVDVEHNDKYGFGFIISIDGKKIGYTSDTQYIPELHDEKYSNLDLLIANDTKPSIDNIIYHLNSDDLINLLKITKPITCIITHMGLKLQKIGCESEAMRISSKSGVHTIAARDSWVFNLSNLKWNKYQKKSKVESSEQRKLS